MNFIISGKNIEITEALRDKIQEKLGKLEKFFNDDTKVSATMSVQKNDQTIEVTIPHNKLVFKASETHLDMYTSIDKVVDTLEKQIIKNKTKLAKKIHGQKQIKPLLPYLETSDPSEETSDFNELKVIKSNKFAAKPMSIDEAAMQLYQLKEGFFMFRNASTSEVNVLYKRNDGNFGLIEPREN
jgi:putative sigma-54 modulation protein